MAKAKAKSISKLTDAKKCAQPLSMPSAAIAGRRASLSSGARGDDETGSNSELEHLWTQMAATADIALLVKPVAYAIPNFSKRLQHSYLGALECFAEMLHERLGDHLEKLETLKR